MKRRTRKLMATATLVAMAASACGGGDDGFAELLERAEADAPAPDGDLADLFDRAEADPPESGDAANSSDTGLTVTVDEGEFRVGGSNRPDWLPVWLILPPDLEISFAFQDPATGDSAVTGIISGGDADLLYEQAKFMVQSGGYIITEEAATIIRTFTAEHTGDGTIATFSIMAADEQSVRWGFEFSEQVGAASPGGDVDRSGYFEVPGVMTVAADGAVFSHRGICQGFRNVVEGFVSEDFSQSFGVESIDPPWASGAFTGEINGVVESWSIPLNDGVVAAERRADGLHYEGTVVYRGTERTVGSVDVACE